MEHSLIKKFSMWLSGFDYSIFHVASVESFYHDSTCEGSYPTARRSIHVLGLLPDSDEVYPRVKVAIQQLGDLSVL